MAQYLVGQRVRIKLHVELDGVETDPSDLTLQLQSPSGVTTTYAFGTSADLIQDSIGDYHVDVIATQPGRWSWHWHGGGAAVGADQNSFIVRPSPTGLTL